MKTFVGSIIDPLADKTLMTILTVTLAMQDLLPGELESEQRLSHDVEV
jgi:phosphatidylglycerophosphate synthase